MMASTKLSVSDCSLKQLHRPACPRVQHVGKPIHGGVAWGCTGGKKHAMSGAQMWASQPSGRHSVRALAQKVTDLPPSLQKIVGSFQMVPDPMARYKQLLFYATKLEKLPAELHTLDNKVEGCVSQVWVVPELRPDGRMYWRADSDSQLTKGLAALLVNGLSGCTPQEIMSLQPDFIEMLGLKQSLTPSRNNGFLNMVRLMQRKTLEMVTASQSGHTNGNGNGNGASSSSHAPPTPNNTPASSTSNSSNSADAVSTSEATASTASSSTTPVLDGMKRKLAGLNPSKLVIEDNSAQHAGHAAMRALPDKSAKETHFRVEVVSDAFTGKSLVQRQRMVYQLLQEEFGMGLHALSLDTKSPAEVAGKQ